ncbi:hypothetical protein [Streptomyces sp. NEAU-L66]|uniref:hypothetical protein n=1 Tax=Streptomyces sp. NEAU-L66 TaxID=3390812 RepID=UPI0039C7156E
MTDRHAKLRKFTLFRRTTTSSGLGQRRTPGESWEWALPKCGDLTEGAPDTETMQRFLAGLRRQLVEDQVGAPLRVTPVSMHDLAAEA